MGQKTHPLGFRLGITKNWKSNWYSAKRGAEYLLEDYRLRQLVRERYRGAGVADVSIERPTEDRVSLVLRTARPGIVIGKGGQEIDAFQRQLERQTGRKVKISIKEIDMPDLEAALVAEDVSYRIENRFPAARALKEVIARVMGHGAKGIKIRVSGRQGGAEIARSIEHKEGRVPLQTIRADIDYGFAQALTKYGTLGVKVWIYRGDIWARSAVTASPVKRGERHGPVGA